MRRSFRDALQSRQVLNVAHRGASGYAPENTLAAFELALAQTADVVEVDVRLTRDGEPVVIHDATVDRTTDGHGEVREKNLTEIRALDAGGWFGPAWRGARVPTLREVLEQFADQVLIDVEFKDGISLQLAASPAALRPPDGTSPRVRAAFDRLQGGPVSEDLDASIPLARKTVQLAAKVGALDRLVLSGFGPGALAWVRETAPEVVTQWSVVSVETAEDNAFAAVMGFEIISPQLYAATEANVVHAHAQGLVVHIYSSDDEPTLERLLALGVDGLKTDRPDRLRTLLANRLR